MPRRDLPVENICRFAKLQDEAYRADLHHILYKVPNQQHERSFTKPTWVQVGPCHFHNAPTISKKTSSVKSLENEEMVEKEEEEDRDQGVLVIEVSALQTTKDETVGDRPNRRKSNKRLIADNGTRQRRPLPPRLQYEDGQTTLVGWADNLNWKIICHSCYCREQKNPRHHGQVFEYDQDDTNKRYLHRRSREALLELLGVQLRSSGGTQRWKWLMLHVEVLPECLSYNVHQEKLYDDVSPPN